MRVKNSASELFLAIESFTLVLSDDDRFNNPSESEFMLSSSELEG